MSEFEDIHSWISSNSDIHTLKVGYMQLHDIISSKKSAVWKQLNSFRDAVDKDEIWRPTEDVQFVFLCGANISTGIPSKRRQLLLDFSSRNLPHAKFFLAESIFQILEAEGHKSNLLDIENDLSAFSDFVVVILESESAFCELGAFATHPELRKKLIVINDHNHRNSKSFINLGPVEAVKETSSGKHVLFYNMEPDGKTRGDGIGNIFKDIYRLIHKDPKGRRSRVKNFDPNKYFSKESLRFIHDLVYFSSPVTLPELSRIIKVLFSSSKEKQLQKHLGLLCATEQVERLNINNVGYYSSLYNQPFFEYDLFDVNNLIAAFKNTYFRYDKKRLP